jgi:hypothetical protein
LIRRRAKPTVPYREQIARPLGGPFNDGDRLLQLLLIPLRQRVIGQDAFDSCSKHGEKIVQVMGHGARSVPELVQTF